MKYNYAIQSSAIGTKHNPVLRQQYATQSRFASSSTATTGFEFTESLSSSPVAVHVHNNNYSELAYLLRLLSSLSEKQSTGNRKWITLINPPASFNKSLLSRAGIPADQIRIAHQKAGFSAPTLLHRAIESETSSAVVAFGKPQHFANQDIQHALRNGDTQAFVISGLADENAALSGKNMGSGISQTRFH